MVVVVVVTVEILEYCDLWKLIIIYFISSYQLYVECLYDPTTDPAGARIMTQQKTKTVGKLAQSKEWSRYCSSNSKVCIS